MKFWHLLTNETANLLTLEVLKNNRTDDFRVTQSFNHHVEYFVQSSQLYMSSENNIFIKMSIGICSRIGSCQKVGEI